MGGVGWAWHLHSPSWSWVRNPHPEPSMKPKPWCCLHPLAGGVSTRSVGTSSWIWEEGRIDPRGDKDPSRSPRSKVQCWTPEAWTRAPGPSKGLVAGEGGHCGLRKPPAAVPHKSALSAWGVELALTGGPRASREPQGTGGRVPRPRAEAGSSQAGEPRGRMLGSLSCNTTVLLLAGGSAQAHTASVGGS